MSVARPSKCVFCTFTRSFKITNTPRRQFHVSPVQQKRKPRHQSLKASEFTDLTKGGEEFSQLTPDKLKQHYSPEQVEAIEAAKKVLDPKKFEGQSTDRADPWSINYYDDFSKIDPVIDQPVRAPWTNIDQNSRLKTSDELSEDLLKLMNNLSTSDSPDDKTWENFDKQLRLTVGKEEAERNPRSALAPNIPKMSADTVVKKKSERRADGAEEDEPSPALVRLMQMTGFNRKQISQLRVKSIVSHRVVNQTRLGKIGKQYFLSIAGNGQGLIGIGEGKSEEPAEARLQSQYRAIRNMRPILRYENRTIFGDVKGKVAATELELYARPPGFGLRCQQYIWEICKCAGISDLAARVTRSRNPMNTVKATVEALLSQKDPEDIARARGKKLVDVRKVYYAGQV